MQAHVPRHLSEEMVVYAGKQSQQNNKRLHIQGSKDALKEHLKTVCKLTSLRPEPSWFRFTALNELENMNGIQAHTEPKA